MKLKNKLNHKVHKEHKGIDCRIEEKNIDKKIKISTFFVPSAVKYSGMVVYGLCALCELIKGWLWVKQNKISVFSVVKISKNRR